jgi:hypothetical protein
LTRNFNETRNATQHQQKEFEEMNASHKTNQVLAFGFRKKIRSVNCDVQIVSELQANIRKEFGNKAYSLEQLTEDFIRVESHPVIASQMSRMEPVLKGSTL